MAVKKSTVNLKTSYSAEIFDAAVRIAAAKATHGGNKKRITQESFELAEELVRYRLGWNDEV